MGDAQSQRAAPPPSAGLPQAERGRRGGEQPRTGAETPVDPEDLVAADGGDPHDPAQVEQARRRLQERGASAVEESTP